jgi:hypothetical protein
MEHDAIRPGRVEHITFSRWLDLPGGGIVAVWHATGTEAVLVEPGTFRALAAADYALHRGHKRVIRASPDSLQLVVGEEVEATEAAE